MTAWEILATMEEIVQMELPLTLALAHLDSKEQIASLVSEIVLSYDFIIVLLENKFSHYLRSCIVNL